MLKEVNTLGQGMIDLDTHRNHQGPAPETYKELIDAARNKGLLNGDRRLKEGCPIDLDYTLNVLKTNP